MTVDDEVTGSGIDTVWRSVLPRRTMPVVDISVSGMRLRGPAPGPVGTEVRVEFDAIDVMATITRADAASFAVHFAPSQEMRASLVRHVYGGRYGGTVSEVSASKVAGAVINRVFR